MKMQRIRNPFLPLMNTKQPFQKPFIQEECMNSKISTTHFQGLMKEFMKTRYPLRVRDTLHSHKPIIYGFMVFI